MPVQKNSSPFGNLDTGMDLELLDDRSFKFRLVIFNEDGKIMKLRKGSIQELVIEDSLFDMCHTGHIIYSNPHDSLERNTYTDLGEERVDVDTFRYRGDARDFIAFEMMPTIDSTLKQQATDIFDSEFYTLRFTFVITHIEDLPSTSAVEKRKKLTFHDKRLQRLIETDLYWNTGEAAIRQKLVAHKKPLAKLSDRDRSVYTGAGIRDILEQCFDKECAFSESWDNGGRQVFYTSPAGAKAYDDLIEMNSMHVSSDDTSNQPCLLRLERYTDEWSLLPYSHYFDLAYDNATSTPGPYQIERMLVSNEVDHSSSQSNPPKVPKKTASNVINNVAFPGMSEIAGYQYSEMPGANNQRYIVSTPVHTYHQRNKTFNFMYKQQAIENMFNFFRDNISSKMLGGSSGPYTDFFINNSKRENRNVNLKNTTHTDHIGVLIQSRNDVLKKSLLYGPAIQFDIKGSTNRRAARFVSIDRDDKYGENDHDSKLLGQYFITNVKHIITQDGYSNKITGVKPYFYSEMDYNHDIT